MNNARRPIFVTGPARSGTSLVAGLLARHGVWVGTSSKDGPQNAKGWFENDQFLHYTRDTIGTHGPVPDDWWTRWPAMMRKDGWDGEQRWLVKAMPWAWKYLYRFNPIVVFCWRPATQIIASHERLGWAKDDRHHQRILRHWDAMRDLRFKTTHVDIPTDRLVAGEYDATQQAFATLGINFVTAIADHWIEPKLWNKTQQTASRESVK